MSKLSNKSEFSLKRRPTTRRSGFKSHPDSISNLIKYAGSKKFIVQKNENLIVNFKLPKSSNDPFIGYGIYFCSNKEINSQIENENDEKNNVENYGKNIWSKIGSIWKKNNILSDVKIIFSSKENFEISIYGENCGTIKHDFLDINNNLYKVKKDFKEREIYYNRQIRNLRELTPEVNFYKENGEVSFNKEFDLSGNKIVLKNCRVCARFLPVNLGDYERYALSFSNHCGEVKKKCNCPTFCTLKNEKGNILFDLKFGFQLECRFCKKFTVNLPHNRQRTTSQLKEDGQRRRHFELLLTELYKSSPLLSYRKKTGNELTNDIYDKFDGKCFNCNQKLFLKGENIMHLDHTRPISLLWQLDGTGTALCKDCNTKKRDKYPIHFYKKNEKLNKLSGITGISLEELKNPSPNEIALDHLIEKKDWFFNSFLKKPDLQKIKQGKRSDQLICKALDKVIKKSTKKRSFSFVDHLNSVFAKQDTDAV